MDDIKEKGQTMAVADPSTKTKNNFTEIIVDPDVNHSKPYLTLPPRQYRAVKAMSHGGWVTRETIDRVSGASNGPEVIRQLRKRLGSNAIETGYTDVKDRDGRPARPGRYRLTQSGLDFLSTVEVVCYER